MFIYIIYIWTSFSCIVSAYTKVFVAECTQFLLTPFLLLQ